MVSWAQPQFQLFGAGICTFAVASYAKIRIAATGCDECEGTCLEGLADWRAQSGAPRLCRAYQCGKAYCVLFDSMPNAALQPSVVDAVPVDTRCVRRSANLTEAPLPPHPPSTPPPPSPLMALACNGRIELKFPAMEQLAALSEDADVTQLPEAFVAGRRRCDASSFDWYEGLYTLDSDGRLAGTSASASRPLLVGGKAAGNAYLWWRPSGNWSRTDLDRPQDLAGWVVTDEAPALAPAATRKQPDRLLPPSQQPLGAREAVYHMPAFTAGRMPTSAMGSLWWAGCGEHVWGVVTCGSAAAPQSLLNPPPEWDVARPPQVGCGSVQLWWARFPGARAAEEIAYQVFFAPTPAPELPAAPPLQREPMEHAGTTAEPSFRLVGLQPARKYTVRVAVNRGGQWSALSSPLELTTLSLSQGARHATELLELTPVAPALLSAQAEDGTCSRLGPVELGALPDCHGETDFQSIELTWAMGDGTWSRWITASVRVLEPRIHLPLDVLPEGVHPLRLYRLRAVLHSDVRLVGQPTRPMLVDEAHSLLGSRHWPFPTVEPTTVETPEEPAVSVLFVPSVRALSSASFEVALPSPQSECQRGLIWALKWSLRTDEGEEHSAIEEISGEISGETLWLPLPRHGLSVLEPLASSDGGPTGLVVKALRCPSGCTFQLLPHNVPGWSTPSAPTDPIRSLPLPPRPPDTAVFELQFRPQFKGGQAAPPVTAPDQDRAREQALMATLREALGLRDEELHVLESRFGAEYIVLAVPKVHATHVVATLLALLDKAAAEAAEGLLSEARAAQGTSGETARLALAQEMAPQGVLLEILTDGGAVRCVAVQERENRLLVWAHLAAVLAALTALAMGSRWAWACAAERKGPWQSRLAGYGSVRPLELLPDEEIEMRSGMDACEAGQAADEQAEDGLDEHGAEEEKAGQEGRSVLGRSPL